MSTSFLSKEESLASRKWLVVDATDVPLGRLASKVASFLRGKHKPQFLPHQDCGDFVVVLNASKVKLTGAKADKKLYRHHTTFVGGVKEITAGDLRDQNPERLITLAVKNMIPSTPLGYQQMTKLKVYAGAEHPHTAQNPELVQPQYS
jgi:large subunit ribosomal protein L13